MPRNTQHLHDGRQRQKHRLGCRSFLECSLDDFEFDESVAGMIVLRSWLRVHHDSDAAELLAKFNPKTSIDPCQ